MLLEKERLDIIAYGMRMNREGLSRGTSGNLSCYDPESGYMAISPSRDGLRFYPAGGRGHYGFKRRGH